MTNHAIGRHAKAKHEQAMRELWMRIHLPDGHRLKAELPARCDKRWFSDVFCAGTDLTNLGPEIDIMSRVTSTVEHDLIAMLACAPVMREHFFSSEVFARSKNSVDHHYIGAEAYKSGIMHPNELRSFLGDALFSPLAKERNRSSEFGSEMGSMSENSDAMLTMSSGSGVSGSLWRGNESSVTASSFTGSRHSGSGSSSFARTGQYMKQQIWNGGGGEVYRRKSVQNGASSNQENTRMDGTVAKSVLELAGPG